MKLLLNQNRSDKLVAPLPREFPGSTHVRRLDLAQAEDALVWAHAREQGFAIVTKDEDYIRLSTAYGHPPKVLYVGLGNCTVRAVQELIGNNLERIRAFENDEQESFLILA